MWTPVPANLMRPAMYGAYHHITVLGKEDAPCDHKYDVTGCLCENNDKFAVDRMLPKIDMGDLLVIHDTGAHGFSMGYNYNGQLRSAELLLQRGRHRPDDPPCRDPGGLLRHLRLYAVLQKNNRKTNKQNAPVAVYLLFRAVCFTFLQQGYSALAAAISAASALLNSPRGSTSLASNSCGRSASRALWSASASTAVMMWDTPPSSTSMRA